VAVKNWTTLQTPLNGSLQFYYQRRVSQRSHRWRRSRFSRPGDRRRSLPLHLKKRHTVPRVHYRVLEISTVDLAVLEETGLEPPAERWLLVERRYGAVGYGAVLRDLWAMLTPTQRLLSQVVGHKSARRRIYRLKGGTTMEERQRVVFGWLRDLVNKNPV